LHFDQYCSLILLALFNPLTRSLRALSQASNLQKVQLRFGVRRASLGSLSEAAGVFDPDLLLPIISELAGQVQMIAPDPRLKEIRPLLTAVDSTLVKTLPRLAEAMWSRSRNGSTQHYWRLHAHFAVDEMKERDRLVQEAHIVAVADAFDAMTSTRSYRRALSQEVAFAELREKAGTQFNPECVEALVRAIEKRGEHYGLGYEEDAHEFEVPPPVVGVGSAGLGDLVPGQGALS